MKLVLKYGGTSISNTKDIQSVAKHVISLSKKNQLVIVCSATSGTTDDLIEISHRISVIFNGNLSKSFDTRKISISEIGLLMGGNGFV